MKTQVFVIHGGHARNSYEDYIEHLTAREVDLEYLRGKKHNWKVSLLETLGDGYDIYYPQMPCRENAKYAEWKLWFDKFVPHMTDGVILVGHSLGGIFLAKYLAENRFPKKVGGVFLVAPPYNTVEEPRADFNILGPLTALTEQAPVFLYHSTDDPIVPFAHFEKYRAALPDAHIRTFDHYAHFDGNSFPEITADIKSLVA